MTGIHRRDNHYRAFARASSQGRGEYMDELEEMVGQLFNAPSVVMWVPFNEGWGQFDSTLVMERLRALDLPAPWTPPAAGTIRARENCAACMCISSPSASGATARPRAGAERIWGL